MSFGVTPTGFSLMRFADIVSALQAAYTGIYGNPNLNADSVIGQRINLESNILAQAWEGLQLAYNAPFPALTDLGSLDNVMDLAGLVTKPPTPTVLTMNCVFSATGTIPAGALIANSAGSIFAATVEIVTSGAGTVQGNFSCVLTGPTYPGTGFIIQTPEANWSSVNLASYVLGTNQETLAEARIRRKNSLMIAGSATLASIRSAILNNVTTVTGCMAEENYTDVVSGTGLLPHSIHIVCQSLIQNSAEKLAIATQIWNKRAGGINMNGSISQNITDSTGKVRTVLFDYSVSVAVPVVCVYKLNPGDPNPAPVDITGAITDALMAVFSSQAIGEYVSYFKVGGACATIPGIDITEITLNGAANDFTGISSYQIATLGAVAVVPA